MKLSKYRSKMTLRKSKGETHEIVKNYIKAISNETRLGIFLLIVVQRDTTLDKICQFVGKSKSTVHHHVQQLLDSGLVEEVTKPGSKTRYYRRVELDINRKIREAFRLGQFEEQTPKKQKEICEMYEELTTVANINMLNTLQFLLDNFYPNLETEDIGKRYSQLGEAMIGFFYLSEENAEEYRREYRELALKYYEDERKNPERKKPYGIFYSGYNVEKALKRKYKKKIIK
ncbi:MAG: winged helix-turn-helix transcriptional regulator [Asgard group archaeon]|nr:winged helix-turn-helix transcriptional regulator [Asgard group archaeon]